MAVVGLLSTGLELIWNRRVEKTKTDDIVMRSELGWAVILRKKSRNSQIREAGDIMLNLIKKNL